MRHYSVPKNQQERSLPNESAAGTGPDLQTIVCEDTEPRETILSATTPARSKPRTAATGPGSEYWLP